MNEELAKAVLSMAYTAGMPDTYWHTDSRIALACEALGWAVEQAQVWVQDD